MLEALSFDVGAWLCEKLMSLKSLFSVIDMQDLLGVHLSCPLLRTAGACRKHAKPLSLGLVPQKPQTTEASLPFC